MKRLLVVLVLVFAAARPAAADSPPAPTIKLVTAGKGALHPLRLPLPQEPLGARTRWDTTITAKVGQ